MKQILATLLVVVSIYALSGCYYDREDILYSQSGTCDTTNITYNTSIAPIMTQYCSGSACHSGALPASGIPLDTYTGVKAKVTDGRLWGSINWQAGFSKMPKNSTSKIPACAIKKIEIWIRKGSPNN